MKITFVYHSCYVVELEDIVLVFDYFKGSLPVWGKDKKVYFFASHKHADHFALEIFQYTAQIKEVTYVLSNDIKFTDRFLIRHGIEPKIKDSIIRVGKNTKIEINVNGRCMWIETLRSTDEGVAFLVHYAGKIIYHAGDLNWWSWSGESKEYNAAMEKNYTCEIDKIQKYKIDVAFVVLDPRLEERYWWGMDYFLKTINVKSVFPMHCWEKYEIISRFKKDKAFEAYCKNVVEVEREGQVFELT